MGSFKTRGVVASGATAYLVVGVAKLQLPQPSLAGTWAELGNFISYNFDI